jgi:CBS domain-containing protein
MLVKACMKSNVYFIREQTSIAEAAAIFSARHIGSLPVVDSAGKLVGLLQLHELLSLVLPDFVNLIGDFDFVHSFGAVENRLPDEEILRQPVTTRMHAPVAVEVESGLLRAYSLLDKHDLHDLPVVDHAGHLVGIVSRVDVGVAIVASWNETRAGEV